MSITNLGAPSNPAIARVLKITARHHHHLFHEPPGLCAIAPPTGAGLHLTAGHERNFPSLPNVFRPLLDYIAQRARRRCDSDEIVPVSMAGTENYASLRRFIIEPKTRLGVIEGATSCTS